MSYKNPQIRKNLPPLTHQQSFSSVRQFVPNKFIETRFSIRKKELNEREVFDEEESEFKRIPSRRKMAISQQKLAPSIPRKAKSIATNDQIIKNEENKYNKKFEESAERRKYSLTLISNNAKKSMQRKLSELIRNENLVLAKKAMGLDNPTKNVNEKDEVELPNAIDPSTSDDSFDDDPEFIELQEREQIVDKYERGPEQKNIDPWENPDLEVYKVADRYGFVHNDSEMTAEQLNERRKQKELQRESKWLKMLTEWKQRHPEKLPSRIWKGIPDKLRFVFWKRILGIEDMKAAARENLYQELLMRARLVSKDIKQIDLDINRTYRDHIQFRRRYDLKQQSLFNVLTAYAMMNTEVGYCQGMSQIAALFLMYMDEEDAFWCLHSLLTTRKYTMHGFFVPGFPKLQRFQNHYDKILLKYLPRVKKHLDNTGIPPIYLTKWWFGCFLDRIPFSLALRLWDVFIYYGDCILLAMSLNIMKMHRHKIMKLPIEEFMEFIQTKLADDFGYPDDKVMISLAECLKRLQSDRMAIPPPPNPRDPSEVPTKPLGPILTRSMLDIRSDIAEVYSRCSRANSLVGRSPAVHKKQSQKMVATAAARAFNNMNLNREGGGGNGPSSPIEQIGKELINGKDIVSPPVEPFLRRVGSTKERKHKPPPVPDEDGFVRMSPRQPRISQNEQQNQPTSSSAAEHHHPLLHKRQTSQYDNVEIFTTPSPQSNSNTTTTNSKTSSSYSSSQPRSSSLKHHVQRAPIIPSVFANEHRREGSTISTESQRHRVHRVANNVTVVQLEEEEDEQQMVNTMKPSIPYCPPPDYPGAHSSMMEGGGRNSSNNKGGIYGQINTTNRTNKQPSENRQTKTMAKPIYSRDETTVIRRF